MTAKVTVLDYGVGNLRSVCRAIEVSGGEPALVDSAFAAKDADRLVVPGVGAFTSCMSGLTSFGFDDVVREMVNTHQRPVLGICVGMQMLFEQSEEFGTHAGLALLPGTVARIGSRTPDGERRKVPHIGWARLSAPEGADVSRASGTILESHLDRSEVYFVHSFAAQASEPSDVLAVAEYGGEAITAAVQRDNLTGLQFHPEKSGVVGLDIVRRFLTI